MAASAGITVTAATITAATEYITVTSATAVTAVPAATVTTAETASETLHQQLQQPRQLTAVRAATAT
jgi:hypothetical protein